MNESQLKKKLDKLEPDIRQMELLPGVREPSAETPSAPAIAPVKRSRKPRHPKLIQPILEGLMRKPKTEQDIFCDYSECGKAIAARSTRHVIVPKEGLLVSSPTGETNEDGTDKTKQFPVVAAGDYHDNCLWKLFKDNLLGSRPEKSGTTS